MNSGEEITLGQRYRQVGTAAFGAPIRIVWVVDALWREPNGLAYVRLINETRPTRVKTLSMVAFANPRLYVRIVD